MKGKIPNIFGVLMALVLAVSLALAAVPATPAVADPGILEWTEVPIPDDTGYTLYPGSDVGPIAVSPDGGTIFAAAWAEDTEPPEAIQVHVTANLTGGPQTLTITYVDQDGNTGNTATATVALNATACTNVGVTLDTGDTGVIDVTAVSDAGTATAGAIEILGVVSSEVYGTYNIATNAFTDGFAGGGYSVMRSTDGGYSWKLMWAFANTIEDIDMSDGWEDDDTVIVATGSEVYISVDRGQTFDDWGAAGIITGSITSLDVGLDADGNLAAVVGTSDGSGNGDVYLRTLVKTWAAQNIGGSYDVLDVGIPTYATDEGIVAVVVDRDFLRTLTRTKLGTNDWGANVADARFVDQNGYNFPAERASLGFPDDYNLTVPAFGGNNMFFVGLHANGPLGDVYKVTSQPVGASPLAEDLDIRGVVGVNPTETEIWSIAVSGDLADATIIAGTAAYGTGTPAQRLVYYSTDAGDTWSASYKSPTGGTVTGPTTAEIANTYVAMGPGIAYAGTSGRESAFSASTTNGMAWNQRGLIHTYIWLIEDIAASETYTTDKQLFMVTHDNGDYSLWLTTDEGTTWERILCNSPAMAVGFDSVQLAAGGYVFVAHMSSGIILRSHDGGTTFLSLLYAKDSITAWKVAGPTTIYTGHADGSIWWTTDFATWDKPEESEITGAVTDIELSDTDILVGDDDGKVYLSTDAGLTFEQVGTNDIGPCDYTYVAFDANYEVNNTLYAGSDVTSDIYRFTVGTSDLWEQISPAGQTISVTGLVCADDGTLYASDEISDHGVWRSVNPTRDMAAGGPYFEALAGTDSTPLRDVDLPSGASLTDLEVVPGSNIVFAINDPKTYQVLMLTDTLTGKPTLVSPACGSTAGVIVEGSALARVVLAWQAMTGAEVYDIEIALDEEFGTIAEQIDSGGTVVDIELWLGTTFYWRVRVHSGAPVSSQWSETCSFITPLGPGAERPTLLSPTSGDTGMCAQDVPVRPVFQWTGLVDATNYEFQVATDAEFTAVVTGLDKTGTSALDAQTAYTSTVSLSEGTNYFWRVRALILDSEGAVITQSPWSDTGCFATEAEAPPPAVPPTPAWVWAVIAIGAILAVGVIVLIWRTRRFLF